MSVLIRTVNETIRENPGMPVKRACSQVGEQLGIPGATLRDAPAQADAAAVTSR